jgi:hypothetical protein
MVKSLFVHTYFVEDHKHESFPLLNTISPNVTQSHCLEPAGWPREARLAGLCRGTTRSDATRTSGRRASSIVKSPFVHTYFSRVPF